MKDINGRDIEVGQIVVSMFDGYSTLVRCRVTKIAKSKVGVQVVHGSSQLAPSTARRKNTETVSYKYPDQVAVVIPNSILVPREDHAYDIRKITSTKVIFNQASNAFFEYDEDSKLHPTDSVMNAWVAT